MYHQNVTGSGFFFTKGTTICITVLIAMMVMAFVPMGLNTAGAAVGDVVLVTTGEADSRASNMTPDGRYIAIQSEASVPGIATGGYFQILRTDLTTGDVVLASSTAAGVQGDDESGHPSITHDARYVAFHSDATNLGGTGANRQIFRKDLTTGAIVLVSSDATGVEGDDYSRRPRISADGRYVAFESYATNLGGTGNFRQIFVKDLNTGAIVLASSDAAWAEGNRETGHPYITPDGRYVSFHSPASNLDPAATGLDTQVFRKDLNTGAIVLVSSDAAGVEADDKSRYSFITSDGRYVSFYSDATNLDPAATGVDTQVFRKDLTTGAVVLASSDSAGVEANDGCGQWGANFMSDDGQYVCFVTEATNLDPTATSGDDQVFRKNLGTGAVVLVSKNSAGVEGRFLDLEGLHNPRRALRGILLQSHQPGTRHHRRQQPGIQKGHHYGGCRAGILDRGHNPGQQRQSIAQHDPRRALRGIRIRGPEHYPHQQLADTEKGPHHRGIRAGVLGRIRGRGRQLQL